MEQLGLVSEDEYLDRLRGAAPSIVEAELRNLLNLVTVTETCFFRDASQFRLLREHIIPTLISERSARTSGPKRNPHLERRLLERRRGVFDCDHARRDGRLQDVSRLDDRDHRNGSQYEGAREGAPRRVYARAPCATSKAGCSTDISCATARTFALSDAIKTRVTFEFGNLTQTPMPSTGPQDIVFCKNVAIYFSADVTRKLIEGLRDTLAPDGYLLLGHAESLWQMSEGFTLVEHERAFCYRKSSPTIVAGRAGRQQYQLKVRLETIRPAGHEPLMRRRNTTPASPPFAPATGTSPRRRSRRSSRRVRRSCRHCCCSADSTPIAAASMRRCEQAEAVLKVSDSSRARTCCSA